MRCVTGWDREMTEPYPRGNWREEVSARPRGRALDREVSSTGDAVAPQSVDGTHQTGKGNG